MSSGVTPALVATSAAITHYNYMGQSSKTATEDLDMSLMFMVPILGWISASWRGFPVIMFGLELPKLMATRAPGWNWTGDVHALLSYYVMLTLVGLHVAAALYHWLVRRDRVMLRRRGKIALGTSTAAAVELVLFDCS